MKEFQAFKRLEALATEVEPSAKTQREAMSLIAESELRAKFFLDRVTSPHWLEAIWAEILPNASDRQISHTVVPYLNRVLKDDSGEYIKRLSTLSSRLDQWSVGHVIQASRNFPPEVAIEVGKLIDDKIIEIGTLGGKELPAYIQFIGQLLPENSYALEMIEKIVAFQPDPKLEEKRVAREAERVDSIYGLWPEPKPALDTWAYSEFINKGVKPLVETQALAIAKILIEATANMLQMSYFENDPIHKTGKDTSESWCKRLERQTYDHLDHEEILAHACFFACDYVFQKSDDADVESINKFLKSYPWLLFKRMRQHLYSKYISRTPSEWVLEMIREQSQHFGMWDHHYEFQLMLTAACEHYDRELFDEGELEGYFEQIKAGPDKQNYLNWLEQINSEHDPEEAYISRQRYFHRTQLRPFKAVLFGEYKSYYEELEAAADKPVTDNDYHPMPMRGGTVRYRSPMTLEAMSSISDVKLLESLNNWNDPQHLYSAEEEPIEVSFGALSDTFRKHVESNILEDKCRLNWWIENAKHITRPIYCGAIAQAMADRVEATKHENIERYFDYCEWVLTHEDTKDNHPFGDDRQDANVDEPSWSTARAAARKFAASCISEKSKLSHSWGDRVFNILQEICVSKDARLEENDTAREDRSANSLISTAINTTRSQAIEDLFRYASWIRTAENKASEIPEILNLLELRFAGKPKLVDAELVLLAMNYGNLKWLDAAWAKSHIDVLFPLENDDLWQACFSAYLTHRRGYLNDFEELKDQYSRALQTVSLPDESETEISGERSDSYLIIKWMGYHLQLYFITGRIELHSETDLHLGQFYDVTSNKRELWGEMFNHMGHNVKDWGADLNENIVKRIKEFFEWRYQHQEPKELSEFLFWLDGKCLEPEWRIDAFQRTLPFVKDDDVKASMITERLKEHFLEKFPDEAIQCFYELTRFAARQSYFYVDKDDAEPILLKGLRSENPKTQNYAFEARENLLRAGRLEYLSLE